MALRIFISHANQDTSFAEWLASYLRGLGADVALGVSYTVSSSLTESINQALNGCDALVLAMTPDALMSPWVAGEMEVALASHQREAMRAPVVVLAKPVPPRDIPTEWNASTWIDATTDYHQALSALAQALGLTPPVAVSPLTMSPPASSAWAPPSSSVYSWTQAAPAPQRPRRYLGVIIAVAVIAALIGGLFTFIKFQNFPNTAKTSKSQTATTAGGIGSPVPSAVMTDLTTVPTGVFAAVGTGGLENRLQATPPNTPVLTSNGKPEIIFVGAEYCPYCAAQRWGTVVALSRFGTFSGLVLMRSSSSDVYPNTPTFSFRSVTYTSQYIVFNATETEDRNQGALATPPADIMMIFSTYNSQGSIPFMSYGNQYVSIGGTFFPTMMVNMDWQQVSSQLKDPNSDVAKAVIGSANDQTAAICKLTNNQPANVCNTPVIQQIEAKLPVAR